ncbi:MAG: tetratricopeptide repeat protein [Armatimonadota bacterium]|nr:tetratricopeptide repeat protein [Armatimonadota bacterium]
MVNQLMKKVTRLRRQIDAAWEADNYWELIDLYNNLAAIGSANLRGEDSHHRGYAYNELGNYDKAIECYHKALDTSDYKTPGGTWNDMGLAYANKGDYGEAIKCYQKALDVHDYDARGDTLNNMGMAYAYKGDHDKAMERYQEALKATGYDTPGDTWHNMGWIYADKGDHDNAIKCYKKALKMACAGNIGMTYYNLGLSYKEKRNYPDALTAFKKASKKFTKAERVSEAEYAEAQAETVKLAQSAGAEAAETMYPALSAVRSRMTKERDLYDPLEELLSSEGETTLAVKAYVRRAERGDRKLPPDALVFLKGWSSSEPILAEGAENKESLLGGGMFFRWENKGLVVDPGIDFVSNFHRSGYLIHDVDGIVVTHDHVDHTLDLAALDDLVFKMLGHEDSNRRRYCLFCAGLRHSLKCKDRYCYDGEFRGGDEDRERVHTSPCIPGISIQCFRTSHDDENPDTFGFVCRMKNARRKVEVGVTSDTSYSDPLTRKLAKCDIIVANIAQPDSKEYNDAKYLNSSHLGLNGTRELIKGTKAQVYVITEFWAGLGDMRVPLCQKLAYDLKRIDGVEGKCIIPADIGMTIDLDFTGDGKPNIRMACSSCSSKESLQLFPCRDIIVVRPDRQYGPIRYLCPDCARRLTLPSHEPGSKCT